MFTSVNASQLVVWKARPSNRKSMPTLRSLKISATKLTIPAHLPMPSSSESFLRQTLALDELSLGLAAVGDFGLIDRDGVIPKIVVNLLAVSGKI